MKNFALVSYFDDLFVEGFKIMLRSFLRYNPWFSSDVIVYDWGISKNNLEECCKLYDKITWLKPDKNNYNLSENVINKYYYAKTFQKFELFKLTSYKKVIVIDADLIIIDNIRKLFYEYNNGFYCDISSNDIPDSGLMVIDNKFLTKKNYLNYLNEVLIEYKINGNNKQADSVNDENVINRMFGDIIQPIEDDYCFYNVTYYPHCKILATPEYKPWSKNETFLKFKNSVISWDTEEEIRHCMKLKKILKELNLEGDDE